MKPYAFIIVILLLFFSCKPGKGLFPSKRLHEQYAQKLKDAGLHQTELGQQWLSAADKALASPQAISLPYKEIGYFPAEKPRAAGLKFSAKRGEKLLFAINKNPSVGFTLFVELWEITGDSPPSFVTSLDSTQTSFSQEADEDETYILRLQPELLKSSDYTLSISTGPTLDFPVPGGKVGSVWGDERDAGVRKHEGIDIFAPKRTPAIAAANGIIGSVRNGGIGGKAIFMRPDGKPFSLYYAHLDEQLVSSGESVKQGDTIGLVGNTGNAATTPPHLHFGIYAFGGAVDPLPFVNPVIRKPANVSVSKDKLRQPMRSTVQIKTSNRAYSSNGIVFPLAASATSFRVELPDGTWAELPLSALANSSVVLRKAKTKEDSFLLESPWANAPKMLMIKASEPVNILGYFSSYVYVVAGKEKGWIPSSVL